MHTKADVRNGQESSPQWTIALAIMGVLTLLTLEVASAAGARQGVLLMLGAIMGVTLYRAAFGFSGAWRRVLTTGEGDGIRAQMLMLAVAVCLFFPLLAYGSAFGRPLHGFHFPVGVSVLVGAFLFGIGMQLGGGCGSGTLYTVGGGSPRMVVTLLFFVVGSVFGAASLRFWTALPSLGPVSLLGGSLWPLALAGHLLIIGAIAGVTGWGDRRRLSALQERAQDQGQAFGPAAAAPRRPRTIRVLTRPWPLLWAAVALAVFNAMTLVLTGRPWGITWAFALWGAKAGTALGFDMANFMGWPPQLIDRPLTADISSVMNLGIILGALLAATLAGRFHPLRPVGLRPLLASIFGGLLLGYGARLAFGCNIGAFFSGIASGSLHGWVWFAAALVGNALGVRLRPWFRL